MEEKKSLGTVIKEVWLEHKGKVVAFILAVVAAIVGHFVG